MSPQDIVIASLTAWRENRGGMTPGMQSVINVICNRANRQGKSVYAVCVVRAQFSSISMPGPESYLWPTDNDPQWQEALNLMQQAAVGSLQDITNGSTVYFAPGAIQTTQTFTLPNGATIKFPQGWNAAALTYQCTVANQAFFTEN